MRPRVRQMMLIAQAIARLPICALCVTLWFMTAAASYSVGEEYRPHPEAERNIRAGTFRQLHDPDRPRLAVYGGIGLYQTGDGRWSGYGVSDPSHVDRLVQRCAENGITQISAHLLEEYTSSDSLDPRAGHANALIHRLVREAHTRNIMVYADMPIFAHTAVDRSFTQAHPHVFTRSLTGELDTHMLSPAYPEVRRHKINMLLALVEEYPVDGVHLDFIRFPYYSYDLRVGSCKHGYDEPILKAYNESRGKPANHLPPPDEEAWITFRAGYVTQFIRELRGSLGEAGMSLPVAVYNSGVYGREDSRRTVLQDWGVWNREHLVQEHHPMFLMSGGKGHLARAAVSLMADKPSGTTVFGPIFLAEGYHVGRPTPEEVRDAARRLIKAGCDGLWFCRASEIEAFGLWPVVKEISTWSLSEVRSESFDPTRENLLRNNVFETVFDYWRCVPPDRIEVSDAGVVTLAATTDAGVVLSQDFSFEPVPVMPVASLDVALSVRAAARVSTAQPLTVTMDLTYNDGETQSYTYPVHASAAEWGSHTFRVPVQTDYQGRALVRALLSISSPAGSGAYLLRDLGVERDRHFN